VEGLPGRKRSCRERMLRWQKEKGVRQSCERNFLLWGLCRERLGMQRESFSVRVREISIP